MPAARLRKKLCCCVRCAAPSPSRCCAVYRRSASTTWLEQTMAKLRREQLSQALNRELAPIYLVSGDEPLLIQEACDAILQAARQAGSSRRELHHPDNHL